MNQDGRKLIDTNIIVYSINSGADNEKQKKAKEIMSKGFDGEEKFYVTVQSLEEFTTVSTSAIQNPISFKQAKEYVETIIKVPEFMLLETGSQDVIQAAELMTGNGKDYWDCVIASVAKNNDVERILTENTKDFQDIEEVNSENPFK